MVKEQELTLEESMLENGRMVKVGTEQHTIKTETQKISGLWEKR